MQERKVSYTQSHLFLGQLEKLVSDARELQDKQLTLGREREKDIMLLVTEYNMWVEGVEAFLGYTLAACWEKAQKSKAAAVLKTSTKDYKKGNQESDKTTEKTNLDQNLEAAFFLPMEKVEILTTNTKETNDNDNFQTPNLDTNPSLPERFQDLHPAATRDA